MKNCCGDGSLGGQTIQQEKLRARNKDDAACAALPTLLGIYTSQQDR